MGQRLVNPARDEGISAQALRYWALFLLSVGVAGHTILIDMKGSYGTEAVMDIIGAVMELIQACAVPLFCFLLVEGVKHTSCYWKYFLRVLGLAVVCEVPFDLVYNDKVMDWSSQNPVLGLAVALAMLYLVCSYAKKGIKTPLVNVLVFFMSLFWVGLMRVKEGAPIILLVTTFWYCRKRRGIQIMVGAVVTCLCTISLELGNPFQNTRYLLAPASVILIHFYNGEPGESNKWINYGAFPVIMMACWLIAKYVV